MPLEILELEPGARCVVDLAEVVLEALDLEPFALRRDHAPPHQVVDRRAPQHRLLAAGVHRDVAADARGVGRGRVDGEHQAGVVRKLHHALGHYAGACAHRRLRTRHAGELEVLDRAEALELFGVDDRGAARQRDDAAGIAGAAAARNDGQAQAGELFDHEGYLVLGIRREHHERHLDAPVGGIGHVRDAGEAVEQDVVAPRDAGEAPQHLGAQRARGGELFLETIDRLAGELEQPRDLEVTGAPRLDLAQAAAHAAERLLAPLRPVEELVLEVRIALDRPDLAEHLVEHARGAPGATLFPQLRHQLPAFGAQQPDRDLPVGERGVVVGNLAHPAHVGSPPKISR